MDIYDFDSSVRNDMDEAVDAINRYMGENGIVPEDPTEPADDSAHSSDFPNEESLIQ